MNAIPSSTDARFTTDCLLKKCNGIMGVPITFMDKFNPEQFFILDANNFRRNSKVPIKAHGLIKDKDGAIGGKPTYARILIQKKKGNA